MDSVPEPSDVGSGRVIVYRLCRALVLVLVLSMFQYDILLSFASECILLYQVRMQTFMYFCATQIQSIQTDVVQSCQ